MFRAIQKLLFPKSLYLIENQIDKENNEPYQTQILKESLIKKDKLGAKIKKDSRSKKFVNEALKKAVGKSPYTEKELHEKIQQYPNVLYKINEVLDQGRLGSCVPNSFTGRQNAQPKMGNLDETFAIKMYDDCRVFDGTPLSQDSGTYVLTGAKIMKRYGLITKFYDLYYQSFGHNKQYIYLINLINEWLNLNRGPIIVGSLWKENMFAPDSRGYVKYSGAVAGGHCYYLIGVNFTSKNNGYFTFVNSWSENWGDKGKFYMNFQEFTKLLKDFPDIFGIDEVEVVGRPLIKHPPVYP